MAEVTILKQVNPTGGTPTTEDGITLLVVNVPVGYVTTGTLIFKSLLELQAAGITQANDLANNVLFYEHCKDFFSQADGTELHVLRVAEACTFTNLFTIANANYVSLQNYLASQAGKLKIIAVTLKPATETHITSLSADVMTAIPLAHALASAEYTNLRPIDIVLEGRKLTGTATLASNLRLLASGNVSVMVGRDATRKAELTTAGNTGATNYAAVGLMAGKLAKVHVGRNIGRVISESLNIVVEFSGGQKPFVEFSETDLKTLDTKGYVFFKKFPSKAGAFFNDDHTCTAKTLFDSQIVFNRVMNKASRIAVATYIESLNDEVVVDATTGQLETIVVQTLQNELQRAIENEMLTNPDPTREREISSAKVTIDPAQNVLATNKIAVKLTIVPLGIAKNIETTIELINPAA